MKTTSITSRPKTWPYLGALALVFIPTAGAIDHSNLDEHRPLRIEDPYPIAHGEIAIEAGLGGTLDRKRENRGLARAEFLWGALPNMHVAVGSFFSSDPHEVEEPEKSGDVHVSALYNFNQETLSLPAFGLKAEVDLPSGVDSTGTDVELKALVTKSFDRLSVHLNAGYTFLHGEEDEERSGRYGVTLGASYPLGAPQHTRTTLVADLFTEQSPLRGDKPIYGAEAGVRHQLGTQTVFDAGVGTEFAGPRERSTFFFTAGISISF